MNSAGVDCEEKSSADRSFIITPSSRAIRFFFASAGFFSFVNIYYSSSTVEIVLRITATAAAIAATAKKKNASVFSKKRCSCASSSFSRKSDECGKCENTTA